MEYATQYALGIVTHTPLWVWLILAGLVYLGLQRTNTRELSASRIVIPAALFGLVAISRPPSGASPNRLFSAPCAGLRAPSVC